jgi:NAD(P)-dependent dehydrogenase (short-subunit alcohol dehydrogenase family)
MDPAEREQFYQRIGQSLPVGRVGEVEDIAQAYLFLMRQGFATGQVLVIDGGTVLV